MWYAPSSHHVQFRAGGRLVICGVVLVICFRVLFLFDVKDVGRVAEHIGRPLSLCRRSLSSSSHSQAKNNE